MGVRQRFAGLSPFIIPFSYLRKSALICGWRVFLRINSCPFAVCQSLASIRGLLSIVRRQPDDGEFDFRVGSDGVNGVQSVRGCAG
jgi:hypothetical protein